MTPDAYCQTKAAARGTSLHYATLLLPPIRRRALIAVGAYAKEIETLASGANDSALAQTKLQWWRAETDRLIAASPSHPVTQAMAAVCAELPKLPTADLVALIDGAEASLRQTRFLDYADLSSHYASTDRALARLALGALGGDPSALPAIERLAHSLRLIGLIANLGAAVRRGLLGLPIDDLRRFEVKAADVMAGRYVAGWPALMQQQAGRARVAWAQTLEQLPAAAQRPLRPVLILGQIAQRQLDEIESENFEVLHQRVALTPLTRFRLAWRTAVFGPRVR
ncbi:MAG: squalene/phytoene synthase family protein [Burkholderiaceae bacterium]